MMGDKKLNQNSNNVMADSPFRKAFYDISRTSSLSLASYGSGGSAGRRRKQNEELPSSRKERRLSHCQSVPILLNRNSHQAAKKKRNAAMLRGVDLGLNRRRAPLPETRNQGRSERSLNKNEEWDDSNMMKSSSKALHSFDLRPKSALKRTTFDLRPKSAIKRTTRTRSKTSRNVSFATFVEPQGSILCNVDPTLPIDNTNFWYKPSDYDKFLNTAKDSAEKTRSLMKYAATLENTYKSSIGLTSPQVLKEYLSCPQEIIGIEHLLAGQSIARSSLKRYHTKDLLDEQRRQKKEGIDNGPNLQLAERLANNSRISSHMAQERAAYVALLD